jgi:hypothetical protein
MFRRRQRRQAALVDAGEQNDWRALQQCPDGYFVLDDDIFTYKNRMYRRWHYGCLAPPMEPGPMSSE